MCCSDLPRCQQIVLHRHVAHNNTFVVQGEHRLYERNGELKEVRATGSYTVSPPSAEPHREGGGDQDVVVLFSIRGSDGVCMKCWMMMAICWLRSACRNSSAWYRAQPDGNGRH